MTDYTKNASFVAKTGTPVQGADFDSEFDEIATAIASKEDKASKGVASGYAGLDGSGLLSASLLPSVVARTDAFNTFLSGLRSTSTVPFYDLSETGVTAQNGNWRLYADGENFYGAAMADDWASGTLWLAIARTGLTVDSVTLTTTAINLTGNVTITGGATANGFGMLTTGDALDAAKLLSGTIPDARIASTGVTQHQASLTIAESQISDGTVYPRIGVAETISGAWTFSGVTSITRASQGKYLHYASSGNTGGAITTSTSAATGSPSNGDLWIQHAA